MTLHLCLFANIYLFVLMRSYIKAMSVPIRGLQRGQQRSLGETATLLGHASIRIQI